MTDSGTAGMTATSAGAGGPRQSQSGETLIKDQANNGKMQMKDVRSPKALMRWFFEDPAGRWPMLLFLGAFLLSLILLIVAAVDAESAHVIGGIATLVVTIFAAQHFKTLIRLREQVAEFEKLNTEFHKENAAMKKEVSNLAGAKDELAKQEERLESVNQQSKRNLVKFQTIESNLEKMGQSNVQGMGHVLKTMHSLDNRLKKQLSDVHRSMYLRVFDEMEFKDDETGMTESEYNEFLNALPAEHRKKLQEHGTFEEIAGDDRIIVIEEFSALLDKMAGAEQASKHTADNAL